MPSKRDLELEDCASRDLGLGFLALGRCLCRQSGRFLQRPFQEMLGDQQESRLLLTIAALCAFEKGLYHASHFRMGEGGLRLLPAWS